MENTKMHYIVKLPIHTKKHRWWPSGEDNTITIWEDLDVKFDSLEQATKTVWYEDWDEYQIFKVELVEERIMHNGN